jgi:hypothetical protein
MRPNLRLDFVPEYPLESVGTQYVPEALVEEYLEYMIHREKDLMYCLDMLLLRHPR